MSANPTHIYVLLPKCQDKAITKPFSLKKNCTYCGTRHQHKLKTCGKCNCVSYCDEQCAKADWKTHKTLCGLLDKELLTKKTETFRKELLAYMENTTTKLRDHDSIWCVTDEDETSYLLRQIPLAALLVCIRQPDGKPHKAVCRLAIQKLVEGSTYVLYASHALIVGGRG